MSDCRLQINVACYAGYRGEETPQWLMFGERRIEVTELVDRWLDPGHRYFKVRGDDGGIYIVRNDVAEGVWELTMFDSGRLPATRLSST